ncbi:MAG: tRNA (adenosine(37)-N6)-threonylcarbamoyltransferase complex ATPase subunit type 1 TsaE [Flavobacteriales bacterium]
MERSYTVRSEEDLSGLVGEFLALSGERRIFVLSGEMGAGKTTLVKAFCDALGVKDPVASPSFSIVNEYRRNSGEKVYHIDLYRVAEEEELFDMGFEELLDGSAYCFVEWPERARNFLPPYPVRVTIETRDESERRILIRT